MAEPQQQPLLLLEGTDSRNNRVMSQLTHSLLSQLNPSLSPSTLAQRSSYIQSRLQHLFHNFHTPTHPPYALMINRAIVELNDKNGSTAEAISEFVRREYEDLPWAHSKILSLHLGRLCEVGEIVCTENGRYMFPVGGMEKKEKEKEKEPCKGSRKRRRGCRSKLALLDSDTTEEASTQVAESDDHLIGSVEEKAKLQSEKMASSIVCAEGSPEGVISTGSGIESSSQTQLQPQKSADIDTDVTTALVCANVDDGELPQDYNQGDADGSLDENPVIECLEKIQPMRKLSRGRPRKSEIDDADWQEKPLLLTRGPTKNKRNQNGQTRGPGRPRKAIQDNEQCEDTLKKKEEKLRKKKEMPRKKEEELKKKEEELMKKDQAKLPDGEGKLKKKDQAKSHECEEKLKNENQAGNGRGRGRGRGHVRGEGRPPKPKVCDTEAPV
ncbi:uncharacterized protein LOC127105073 [Lathyrus oleraceus]|uniref:H15 domain-containing protein n=1 Tax=Pisum sativum TaxID=3888 RepID=A0A9D4VP34_PEA|nr:uncharacterized protein LOC127105073 [Pisum sativum]KAI5387101.1 hypothetical protein KIW84_073311 [Pisum sativum]